MFVGSKCITSLEKLKKTKRCRLYVSFPLPPENKCLSLTFFSIVCGRGFFYFFYKTIKTWGVNKWINEIWTQLHFLILPLMSSVCDVARRSDDIIVLKPILKKQKKLPTLLPLPVAKAKPAQGKPCCLFLPTELFKRNIFSEEFVFV